jgi:hypothetical protein
MTPPQAHGRDHHALEALRRDQCDVVTRAQLAQQGFRRDYVRERVVARDWQSIGHRVVVLSAGPLTNVQRCRAAVLHAGPKALLAGLTSLELAGLTGWERTDQHVLVPAGTYVAPLLGVTIHRSYRLASEDATEIGGIPATTAARSALDAARWDRSPRTAAALVIAVVQQRLCTPMELVDVMKRFDRFKQKLAIAEGVEDARDGAESRAEVIAAELLVRAGFPTPRRQVEILTSMGVRRVDLEVDLGDGRFLVVEVDGPHHEDPDVRLIDAVKDAAVVAAGGHMHHVLADDVHMHPERVLREFRALHQLLT